MTARHVAAGMKGLRSRYGAFGVEIVLAQLPTDACVLWPRQITRDGYGRARHQGKTWSAHRLIWTLTRGPIGEGLTLDHLCRNRLCVNPAHLEPVSPLENTLRGEGLGVLNMRKQACPRGHPYSGTNIYGKRICSACDNERRRVSSRAVQS